MGASAMSGMAMRDEAWFWIEVLWAAISQHALRHLYSRATPDPYPVTSEGAPPLVDIFVLKAWSQCQLVCIEVQPTTQDGHRIGVLNHRVPHQCFHHIIVGRKRPRPARLVAIYRPIDLRRERIDIIDGILFACGNVDAALIVRREAGLFRPTLAWVLYCSKYFAVGFAFIDKDLLGDVVEAA